MRKTALAILTFLALAALPAAAPFLKYYQTLDWSTVPAVLDFAPRNRSASPIRDEEVRLRPDIQVAIPAPRLLVDPDHSLDAFYRALHRTEMKREGAVTRVLHYGDSPTTADMITADIRGLLQKQFGDAGHGFCLIAKPWAWYGHRGLEIRGSGWKMDPANQSEVRDGLFGIGGVSFRGGEGARGAIELRAGGHTQMEFSFLKQPGGGAFAAYAEGELLATVETAHEPAAAGYAAFSIPETARRFEIRVQRGPVRLFGVQFRKPAPGVVYDSLGLNGGFVNVLSRMFREEHWAAQLKHYRPDLVIINYGTNESVYPDYVTQAYERELKEAIRRLRAAVPQASIMVMSPMDRGERDSSGEISTVPVLPRLVAIEREVAAQSGCAFFNTFEAMGGAGSMGRWYEAEPRLVGADFTHPMPAGAKIVGNLLYRALLEGYNRYKLRELTRR